jgi:protein-S-isoprenylcysteine O-methyltransferase Ste14
MRTWEETGRTHLSFEKGTSLSPVGIFRQIRHPMYSALLLYSLGQVLVVPNWVAGPPFLIAFALLVALRIAPEERMMLDKFGDDYEAYMARTKRLIPGVW